MIDVLHEAHSAQGDPLHYVDVFSHTAGNHTHVGYRIARLLSAITLNRRYTKDQH